MFCHYLEAVPCRFPPPNARNLQSFSIFRFRPPMLETTAAEFDRTGREGAHPILNLRKFMKTAISFDRFPHCDETDPSRHFTVQRQSDGRRANT